MIDKQRLEQDRIIYRTHSAVYLGLMAVMFLVAAMGIFGSFWPLIVAIGGVTFAAVLSKSHAGLTMRAYGAIPLSIYNAPGLYAQVHDLSQRAGLNCIPALYWIPSLQVNAFAAGKASEPAIAITDGMLRLLSPREIRGVLAHEIAHLKNGDLTLMSLGHTLTTVCTSFAQLGQILFLLFLPITLLFSLHLPLWWPLALMGLPFLNSLLNLALSRAREFEADRTAAELSGDPVGLASALKRMEHLSGSTMQRLLGRPEIPEILRTHPPTSDRIQRLLGLIRPPGLQYFGN